MTATRTPTAIQLPCPYCGEAFANLSLNLYALDGDGAVTCQECQSEFSLEHDRDLIGRWTKVLRWVDAAPTFSDSDPV